MDERWVSIPGYEDRYWVSNAGRVKSAQKVLKPWVSTHGYRVVSLSLNGVVRKFSVHRLVLTTFSDQPSPTHEVCHRDGDQSDNSLANLYWGTRSRNILDQVAHGTHNNARKVACRHGHDFTPENTFRYTNGRRGCITCIRASYRRQRAKRVAA